MILFILVSTLLNIIYAIILSMVFLYSWWLISENKKQQYQKETDKQILEIIRLFRNSVISGESITQTIDSVSEQIKEPLSLEFKEISNKVKLGISLDEALKDSVIKIQNEQYKFFMDSIRISYSTGIKISDILSKIEQTVSQKLSLSNKVDVLTSQVRFSGMIISIIPFFIVFLIYFVEPEMISVLFTSVLGNMILLICVIMILLGSFVMKRIADIKL
ncbi:MAG: type II secretion system F family protein [Elusimicrobia bacterium]|nr:type II secretion system F family protein [Elusimicrobiota bacterium]